MKKVRTRPRSASDLKRAKVCQTLEAAALLSYRDLDNLPVDDLRHYRREIAQLHAEIDYLHGVRVEQKPYDRRGDRVRSPKDREHLLASNT